MCYCGKPEVNLHGLPELVIVSKQAIKMLLIGFVVMLFLSHAQVQPIMLVATIIEAVLFMICSQIV